MTTKVVMTGGAGFLGRSILQQIASGELDWSPTIYSRDEMKQWEITRRFPFAHCVLGDVGDLQHLTDVIRGHDVVLHLAAVKFIPEAERNVRETINVNIHGSENVAIAAAHAGVQTVVGISTDKACQPQTTYGVTKLVMERLFSEWDTRSSTRFVTVRYGNVVGSTGSVIPIFRQQLEETGRMRLTDPGMTRFWLSPEQAVGVIRWALAWAAEMGGDTFIPQCPAMSLLDIAASVYTLWSTERGEEPDCTLPADIVGARPAEKLHEMLLDDAEAQRAIRLDPEGYVMAPPIRRFGTGGTHPHYSSDQPAAWLPQETMIDWIKEARNV